MNELSPIDLPPGIRSSFAENVNGLRMHYLETGPDDGSRPLLLLLHGFPELAYSWRKVMVPLAERGYHVVAPDQRGFADDRLDDAYDQDLRLNLLNLVRDAVALIRKLGYDKVEGVFGHDFGSLSPPTPALLGLTFPLRGLDECALAGPPVFADNNASVGPSIFDNLAVYEASEALSPLLQYAFRQRRNDECTARIAWFFTWLFSRQECRLARQRSQTVGGLDRGRNRADANLLHYGA